MPNVSWPAPWVALLALCFVATTACSEDSADPDTFDPSGVYRGPATVIGEAAAKSVVIATDQSVTFSDDVLVLGPACALDMVASTEIGVQDTTTGDDDSTRDRELASVQTPNDGQMCTLTTTTGSVTFTTTDGVVTFWRAATDGTVQASISGSTDAGGTVVYTFKGYR